MQLLNLFLKQIYDINKRYEEITRLTGENFNIFRILGLSSDELSHSSFISSLLNPKGSHGQGNKFLKLFLELEEVNIRDFGVTNAKVKKEKYIGPIDKDHENGGRIDILISDNSKNYIIIENKIYAADQEKQLFRYRNYLKNSNSLYLIYLTLNGADASPYSLGSLTAEDYLKISYRETIINWLEKCKKESINFPLLRETISQYIFLIKKITGQARSQEMANEIIETIMNDTKNIKSAFSIAENINELKKQIVIKKLIPSLEKIAIKNKLENPIIKGKYLEANWGFDFQNKEWKNYKIRFKFLTTDFKNFIYGFYSENDEINIYESLKVIPGHQWKSGKKTRAYKFMDTYKEWDAEVFIKLSSNESDNELLNDIETKVIELLLIGKELQNRGVIL